jgi:citrate lyase subunit beta / citryl-CoA lyase
MAVAKRRSWLYVPGDRPERFANAVASGADVLICDLEDAVGGANKAVARQAVAEWLRRHRAVVRVNGVGTAWHDDDVAAIADAPGLIAVLLAKSEAPAQIQQLAHRLGNHVDVIPLVETAAGVAHAGAIAAAPQVAALAFGSIDFALDLGIDDTDGVDETAVLYARSTLVIASRTAGIAPPIEGVTVSLSDAHAIRRDARRARALGFGGKQCIHPRQVHEVNAAFNPSTAAIARALRVIDAAQNARGSAIQLDGQMIDKPRIDQARRVLSWKGDKS